MTPQATHLARMGFADPESAARLVPEPENPGWQALLVQLGEGPDPDSGLRRLLRISPEALEIATANPGPAAALCRALAFSEAVAEAVVRQPALAVELVGGRPFQPTTAMQVKDAGLARIAVRDLNIEPTRESFIATGLALTELADECIAALEPHPSLVVIAMGKYGGGELNYASDIDVLFTCPEGELEDASRSARQIMSALNGTPTVWRCDADLRPEGRDGPLVRTVASYDSYWGRWAEQWEFQSLLKARHVIGPEAVFGAFEESARKHVWPETLAPKALEQIRHLKGRAEARIEGERLHGRQVKLGRGGIRDVEFAVQLLQLVHGRHHPELRLKNTLEALDMLGEEGFVAREDAEELADALVFLRHVEHRLQLAAGRQTHTLPESDESRRLIARAMGHRGTADETALKQFDRRWRDTTTLVRGIHERLFYRPLLAAFAGAKPVDTDDRLRALGFDHPGRALKTISKMTAGTTRSAKVMRGIAPAMLGWLADAAEPDAGLMRLAEWSSAAQGSAHLLGQLRDQPHSARILARIFGTSGLLSQMVLADPSLVGVLEDTDRPSDLATTAVNITSRADDPAGALRRFRNGHWLRIAARGIGEPSAEQYVDDAAELSAVADACLEAALTVVRADVADRYGGAPDGPFSIIALGRHGGLELSLASDLDVIFVYAGDTGEDARRYHEEVAESILRFMATTPPIFKVDAELRPEGKAGPLARSFDAYVTYWDRWAANWEFQAMLRARHAAGDAPLSRQLIAAASPRVFPPVLTSERVDEIRHMKARIERERTVGRGDPKYNLKLGPGGLSDVEFTVQLIQIRHGHNQPALRTPNTYKALNVAGEVGLLTPEDLEHLSAAYVFLNRLRNHLFLLKGLPTDQFPVDTIEVDKLARSMGFGRLARDQLTEEFLRVTRRARAVCERAFYGQ